MKKIVFSFFTVLLFAFYVLLNSRPGTSAAGAAAANAVLNNGGASSAPQTPAAVPSAPEPTASPAANTTAAPNGSRYKNGSYVGSAADAFYGTVQVKAVIKGGQLTDIGFLQYPSDTSHSIYVSEVALPMLKQEAIQAQSANVDIISGATETSGAFQQSLQSALAQARA